MGCPVLSLAKGQVTYTRSSENGVFRVGTNATYDCDDGYQRTDGSRVRTCQESGNWNGDHPFCRNGNKTYFVVFSIINETQFYEVSFYVFEQIF